MPAHGATGAGEARARRAYHLGPARDHPARRVREAPGGAAGAARTRGARASHPSRSRTMPAIPRSSWSELRRPGRRLRASAGTVHACACRGPRRSAIRGRNPLTRGEAPAHSTAPIGRIQEGFARSRCRDGACPGSIRGGLVRPARSRRHVATNTMSRADSGRTTLGDPIPAIRLVGLHKRFGDVVAVAGIDLEVARRRVLLDARAVRVGQDDDAADDRRVRAPTARPDPARTAQDVTRPAAVRARREHRLPGLRAVPPHERRPRTWPTG